MKGYTPAFGLTFMHLDNVLPERSQNVSVAVKKVENRNEMEAFSKTQCSVFTGSDKEYGKWYPFLKEANFRNLTNPTQKFYIGNLRETTVACSLAVVTNGAAGIYAVATLREHRQKGVSTSIMFRCIADAVKDKKPTPYSCRLFQVRMLILPIRILVLKTLLN